MSYELDNSDSNPKTEISLFVICPERLWDPPKLLSSEHQGLFREAPHLTHSSLPNAKV